MKFLPCAILALASLPMSASAFTECPGLTLTRIWTDVNGDFFIATGGDLNGRIPVAAYPVGAKPAVMVATAAYFARTKIKVRYKADGVSCGSARWDEEISSIGVND
ncbi:hypothetical protein [Rhizobacter sp. Root16D2]|uniref:hypothetical protein n=1 Tax=Rhizobacter sp. Root16D2 TaxID=1736479 RepID=UPI0012F7BDC7|nr:hypothetical protein [Rhizobacter sp. Root16D2]